jgi:hypothetical protein
MFCKFDKISWYFSLTNRPCASQKILEVVSLCMESQNNSIFSFCAFDTTFNRHKKLGVNSKLVGTFLDGPDYVAFYFTFMREENK